MNTQLVRLHNAMQQAEVAAFQPDGKSSDDVGELIDQAESAKASYAAKPAGLRSARGGLFTLQKDGHDKSVSVYGAMRSVYRRDSNSLLAIRRPPKRDKSARQTAERMRMTASVWAGLPNMPGTGEVFKLGAITRAVFEAAHATSFTVQHKAPGAVEFETAATDVTGEFWDATGQAVGNHQYVVIGHNSRGDGPVSEIVTVNVAVAAVA